LSCNIKCHGDPANKKGDGPAPWEQ
jgi:hypothetical protein